MRTRPAVAAVAALTALAAALRFSTLALQSFWVDEAVTHRLVGHSFGSMLSAIPGSESTPPLYYVLAWPWTRLFGSGEAGLRSLSALAGTLTVPVMAALAYRLGGKRAAIAAAALTACNPLLIWYSQEARSYALLLLLAALSLLLALRAAEAPGGRSYAAWAAAAALALATHYFALFLVVPEALWLLARTDTERRSAVAAVAAVAAAGAALLPLAVQQSGDDRAGFIHDSSLGTRILQVPKQFLVGYHSPAQVLLTALAAALAVTAAALLLRAEPAARRRALAVGGLGLAALALPLALALGGADYLIARNMLAAWAPLAGAGAVGLARGRAGAIVAAGLCAVGLAAYVGVETHPADQRADWRGAARVLRDAPGPRVIVLSASAAQGLEAYLVARPLAAGATVRELDVLAADVRGPGRADVPEPKVLQPPPGFALAGVERKPSYALVRYRAPRPLALAQQTIAQYAVALPAPVALLSP